MKIIFGEIQFIEDDGTEVAEIYEVYTELSISENHNTVEVIDIIHTATKWDYVVPEMYDGEVRYHCEEEQDA